MSDDLYQQAIVDLARAKTGAGQLAKPTASATADNPLCGDRASVDLDLSGGRIVELAHRVRGCLLCQASASALARAARGATTDELREGGATLEAMLTVGGPPPIGRFAEFSVFQPVARHRSRHDCVALPVRAALKCLSA